jgi:hypothetical protein
MATDELRIEAARLLHEADKADREATKMAEQSIQATGVVNYNNMRDALQSVTGSSRELMYKSAQAWSWLDSYLVQSLRVPAVCAKCRRELKRQCDCDKSHYIGTRDWVSIRISDLITFKNEILGLERGMTKPARAGVVLLYQFLDENRKSDS